MTGLGIKKLYTLPFVWRVSSLEKGFIFLRPRRRSMRVGCLVREGRGMRGKKSKKIRLDVHLRTHSNLGLYGRSERIFYERNRLSLISGAFVVNLCSPLLLSYCSTLFYPTLSYFIPLHYNRLLSSPLSYPRHLPQRSVLVRKRRQSGLCYLSEDCLEQESSGLRGDFNSAFSIPRSVRFTGRFVRGGEERGEEGGKGAMGALHSPSTLLEKSIRLDTIYIVGIEY